jgi:translation initiation factor 1
MGKNDKKTLSWDSFQSLGNPENVPEEIVEKEDNDTSVPVRIHLEKKHRGGKEVAIIRGLDMNDDDLKLLAKELKSKCGTGGSSKNGEILIQGNMREKLLEILKDKGYKNTKLAGG